MKSYLFAMLVLCGCAAPPEATLTLTDVVMDVDIATVDGESYGYVSLTFSEEQVMVLRCDSDRLPQDYQLGEMHDVTYTIRDGKYWLVSLVVKPTPREAVANHRRKR